MKRGANPLFLFQKLFTNAEQHGIIDLRGKEKE